MATYYALAEAIDLVQKISKEGSPSEACLGSERFITAFTTHIWRAGCRALEKGESRKQAMSPFLLSFAKEIWLNVDGASANGVGSATV